MNPQLQAVESVFNAFCSCVDKTDSYIEKMKSGGPLLRDEIRASALFTFEASTCDRIFELARERGNSVPVCETPLPFDRVMLADNLGVVCLHLIGETDESDVLRRMSVIVYLRHLDAAGGWMLAMGIVDYLNDKSSSLQGEVFSIDPRSNSSTNIMRLNGPLKILACDGKGVHVEEIPETIRPAMRGAEVPANPTPEIISSFILRDYVTSTSSALEQLYYVNLPRHHVVEATPAHILRNAEKHERQAKTKALRFADRIRYVLVEPEKVREIRPASEGSGEGTHASPVPHSRSGYTKILRAARFKKRRWAVVHVRPTWVGDEEWDHSNIRYRVVAPGAVL